MKGVRADDILRFVQSKTETTAAQLASALGITKEGARLKLLKLSEAGQVQREVKKMGVGRPVTYYTLTASGLSRLPDAHAKLSVDLLQAVKKLMGAEAIDQLINEREKKRLERYVNRLRDTSTLEEKLQTIVKIRSEEGYMAEWKEEAGDYVLVENHCPICAAATECKGFCKAELENFKALIGEQFRVEREQHLLSGDPHCVYRIKAGATQP